MASYLLNLVYGLLLLAASPVLLYRAAKTGKYREGIGRKFLGAPPELPPGRPPIWVHAVSVGEVMLLKPLFERLRRLDPGVRMVLSTSTNTGYALACERYPDVPTFYAPLDFTWAVGRVFDRLQPSLLVLTELELWPNLLLTAKRRGVPVAVINARLGERSFRGYSRIATLLRPALSAIRWWGAQTDVYRRRIESLIGVSSAVVETTGSLKYDGAQTDRRHPRIQELGRLLGYRDDERVLLAGSTMEPEEEIVVDAFLELAKVDPHVRLLLAPRHKERFDEVAAMLQKRGVEFIRRSAVVEPRSRSALITLGDTIGELSFLWGLAELGFVGGSLECRRGGQSMIEPAGLGVPVCVGPNTWNFQDAVERLRERQAIVVVESRDELLEAWRRWLTDPAEGRTVGERARQFLLSQQGSVEKTAQTVLALASSEVAASLRRSA